MARDPEDADADRLSSESLAAGDPTGWFDRLYREARAGTATVPWDRGAASAALVEWASGQHPALGARALVVGCGLGRDSEYVASLGYATTAFDISPTAVEDARQRHPDSAVDYRVADLLEPPAEWAGAFDLVVESNNVQSLPPALHAIAADAVASLVAPGGTLVVLAARLRDGDEPAGPPWPLTRAEIGEFAAGDVRADTIDELSGDVARWRAVFRRPS